MTADCVRCPCPVDFYALGQNVFRWGLLPDAGGEVAECSSTLAIRCFCYRWQCSLALLALSLFPCWPLNSLSLSLARPRALCELFLNENAQPQHTGTKRGNNWQADACVWVSERVCVYVRVPLATTTFCKQRCVWRNPLALVVQTVGWIKYKNSCILFLVFVSLFVLFILLNCRPEMSFAYLTPTQTHALIFTYTRTHTLTYRTWVYSIVSQFHI